jgi:hypothetical protein
VHASFCKLYALPTIFLKGICIGWSIIAVSDIWMDGSGMKREYWGFERSGKGKL